ncbi:hypothetical protein [Pseudonocardia spinosispora]|uniref:hypothetical protein n=1 Tax=Pseudonocardia spinosispora TaxID=103441 RepID=UPI0012EC2A5C|nr:hypothetical protein [Pseudonocardia spinosispora]
MNPALEVAQRRSSSVFCAVPGRVLGVAVLQFSVVRVSVDSAGLRVCYGTWRWPRRLFPLADVLCVRLIDIRPLHWDGWGYRGSRRLTGRAAAVIRRGAAVQIDLRDGTSLTVTVDDADTGVMLLAALLARL